MSRIDEALRQAGKKSVSGADGAEPEVTLDAFPDVSPESPATSERPFRASMVSVEQTDVMPAWNESVAERFVTHRNADTVVVEQYRRLAGILHQAQVDRAIKVVMLGSAQAAEGKTLTAANLALTLSESYKRRVLLIDADLRRPSLGRVFGIAPSVGLSECLRSQELETLRITNVTESLGLLMAGHADQDPMGGLTSGRMQEIIEQAAAGFDWVIIDTPPLGLMTDAHLLSAMVDAAVLVIDAGTTQHAVVQRAIESIGREKIVGIVLNRVERRALAEASYYTYYGDAARTKARRKFLTGKSVVAGASGTTR
jgi:capsular exopolysaccharide synthesis family protein